VSTTGTGGRSVRDKLGQALRQALRDRDPTATAAIRSALAAIDNAEAVADPMPVTTASSPYIAGAAPGAGAAEVARREPSGADAIAIVRAEIAQRIEAADRYGEAGRADRAARLRGEADALQAVVSSLS
jgi:uncharacterized protein